MKKVGFIVNPVAGLGGSVGLKGSDGADVVRKALGLGAKPHSGDRGLTAIKALLPLAEQLVLYTCPGKMGEDIAREAGFLPQVMAGFEKHGTDLLSTTAEDTIAAAKWMAEQQVDLLIFAGGDGTARNIYTAIGDQLVVLGIPAGVKIHSAVYATDPRNAGLLALEYLKGQINQVIEGEVMDIDEEAFRRGQVSAALYGYMRIPLSQTRLQGGKVSNVAGDQQSLEGIGAYVAEEMLADTLYLIGPGSTTGAIMKELQLPNTLLGVDLVKNHHLVASDVGEREIMQHLEQETAAKIIVTPIGGQACLFGRGNQQLSPSVLRRVGKQNIMIVATKAKLQSFYGDHLLVDTGDEELNSQLCGYSRVIVAYKQETVFRIGC